MNKILLAAVLAASAVISGCTEKQDAHPSVKIVPTIKTRVSGLHFDDGDQIGLTILKGEQPYAENHPMTYEGSAFSGSGLLWYDDLNETSTLTAYHPYSSAGVPAEFTVAADQTGGCASSDLLGAVKRDVKPGSAPVGMVFYHLMSQLTIFLTNNSGVTVTSVSVGGLVPTATVDLTVPTAAAKADAAVAEIRAFKEESGTSYRVILVPQQAALTVTVGTSDGKSHSKTVASAQLVSGKQYDMSVTLTKIDMSVSLSGDINDWGEGGSLDGDDGGDDGGDDTGGAMNAPIQGSAADLIKIAMIKVVERMKKEKVKSKLLLQIHDELIFEVPKEEMETMISLVKEEMENVLELKVPLQASISCGKTWYEAK